MSMLRHGRGDWCGARTTLLQGSGMLGVRKTCSVCSTLVMPKTCGGRARQGLKSGGRRVRSGGRMRVVLLVAAWLSVDTSRNGCGLA